MPSPELVLSILLSIATLLLIIWGGRRATVSPLITMTWVLHCVLWFLLPVVLQLLLTEPVVNSPGPLNREQLNLLSAGSMFALAVCFIGLRRPVAQPVVRFFDDHAPPLSRLFWPTAIVLVIFVVVEWAMTRLAGNSFSEVSAFVVQSDNSQQAQFGLLGTVETMLIGYSIALVSMGTRSGVTRGTMILAWTSVGIFCAFMIARGTRSTVFLPIVLGLVALSALHGRKRRRAAIALAIGSCAMIAVGAPVAAIMGVARGGSGGVSLDLIQEAYDVTIGSRSLNERFQLLAGEINRKFDAIGPAVELLAMETPGSAGLAPISSSLLSPIPRAVYLSKPVPTSRDGTYLGTPYRIAAKAYGNAEVGMIVPVSAVAIAVWELSGVGVLVFVLVNLFNLVLLNTVFVTQNIIARAVAVSMLGLSLAEFYIGPPSSLLTADLRLIMYLVVLALAILAWRLLWANYKPAAFLLRGGHDASPSPLNSAPR